MQTVKSPPCSFPSFFPFLHVHVRRPKKWSKKKEISFSPSVSSARLDSTLLPPKNYTLFSNFSYPPSRSKKNCNTSFLSRTRNFLEKLEIFLRKGGRGRSSGVRATAAIFANHGCRSCGGSHRAWSSPG